MPLQPFYKLGYLKPKKYDLNTFTPTVRQPNYVQIILNKILEA